MSEFNLPPGVSIDMIPGNRPEDKIWERWLEDNYPDYDELNNEDRMRVEEEFQVYLRAEIERREAFYQEVDNEE